VKYVPTLDMYFESAEDALAFYIRYARLAGFDIRRNRTMNNGRAQEVECSTSGEYKGGLGLDRTRGKTIKKKIQSNGVYRKISNTAKKVKNKIATFDRFCLIHDFLCK
jgi:hypothetical protein